MKQSNARRANPNRSSLCGRRPTESVPSIEEFLGVPRDPHAAFLAGHVEMLRDVIRDARHEAFCRAERRAYTAERIMLPNGSVDASVQPTDPIELPAWAFDALGNRALGVLEGRSTINKRRPGDHGWFQWYRASLIDWHRYVLVRRAIDEGYKASSNRARNLTAFEIVEDQLAGTMFAGGHKAIERSFRLVSNAISRGEAWRFYRSRSFGLYGDLLDPDADIVVVVPGIHGSPPRLTASERVL